MTNSLIVILCAVGAVAFFAVGMSLTLLLKGRPMDSEIATNPHMRRLGIKCAVQEAREAQQGDDCDRIGCSGSCSSCDIEHAD